MNRILNIGLVVGIAWLTVGCATTSPRLNSANKHIVLVDGKNYAVPYGTTYTNEPVTNKAIDFYRKIGVNDCKYGDITWEEKATADAINKIMRSSTKAEGIALYNQAAKDGKVGCASPKS